MTTMPVDRKAVTNVIRERLLSYEDNIITTKELLVGVTTLLPMGDANDPLIVEYLKNDN